MADRNRYRELDALRGIAAMAVVITHLTGSFDLFFPEYPPLGVSFPYGGLGVQLFFMISGYVILMTARRYADPAEFAQARGVRLYPTYWASLTLTVMVVFGLRFDQLYRPWGEIAVNYTMLQSFVAVRDFDGAYWSLAREIVFYIFIGMALWAFRGSLSDRFVVWFSIVWSAAGLALILLHRSVGAGWTAILSSASVGQYAPLFGLGMLLYARPEGRRLHPAALALTILAVANESLVTDWVHGILILGIILAFAVVVSSGGVKPLRHPWLVWLGAVSYPLYLLHQNIGYVVIGRTIGSVGPWMSRLIALAVVILLAWAVHELVEVRVSRALNHRLKGQRVPR